MVSRPLGPVLIDLNYYHSGHSSRNLADQRLECWFWIFFALEDRIGGGREYTQEHVLHVIPVAQLEGFEFLSFSLINILW